MAVDTTIPHSSNNVGDDLSAIRENFELLASAQVVDEGSTADGDYIRWENGWQVCKISIITLEYESSDRVIKTWDFPQSFNTDNYYVSFQVLGIIEVPSNVRDNYQTELDNDSRSTNSVILRIWNNEGNFTEGDEIKVTAFAIGRWK